MVFVNDIFFFKQKTAYEMRISDWSSDVCSSDLLRSPTDGTALADRPAVKNRQPDGTEGFQLPRNTVIVSADDHLAVTEDIFYQRFPAGLKDRAPRILQEGAVNHLGFDGQTLSHSEALLRTLSENEEVQGCYDLDVRYEQMTAEGVQKSINFPQLVILLARYPEIGRAHV